MDCELRETHPNPNDRDPEHYTKFDAFERALIDIVIIIAAYDCPQHDPKAPCSCSEALAPFTPATKDLFVYIHFVEAWEQCLLAKAAAFIFKNTPLGKKGFETLHGQSAQAFVKSFAERTFATPSMLAPAGLLETTIEAMFAFWDNRASTWKSKYSTRHAARRDLKACMPDDQGSQMYGHELCDFTDHHQPGQGLLITQRFDRFPPNEKEHCNTVFLLPLLPRLGNSCVYLRHKLLGVRRCHEDCDRIMPALKQSSIENFRRGRFQGRTVVEWAFDDLQHSYLEVRYTDPVEGATQRQIEEIES